MTVTVFGSINIDLAAYTSALPRPGETLAGRSYGLGLGGKGCNQAIAAARLAPDTALVGRVGRDEFGSRALADIAGFGVATDHVLVDPDHATGIAVIAVADGGENMIIVVGGANMACDGTDVERARGVFARTGVLLLQLEIPMAAAQEAAAVVRAHGGRAVLDPAPAPAGGLAGIDLAAFDVITPNETETHALVGIRPQSADDAARAARALRARGIGTAVVKLGARGVWFDDGAHSGFVPPFTVQSIDSVAAGDCFNGGLAAALSEGRPIAEAVRFAAACGALSTTRRGAAASAPTAAEVRALLG